MTTPTAAELSAAVTLPNPLPRCPTMNDPNHYHTMTDAQLAEWHQLTVKVDKLTRDRDALQLQLADKCRELATVRGARTADELDWRAERDRQMQCIEEYRHEARRMNNKLAALVACVDLVLELFRVNKDTPGGTIDPRELSERLKALNEVNGLARQAIS